MPDPSHAAQGDPTKRAVDEVGDRASGLVLPVAAPPGFSIGYWDFEKKLDALFAAKK